MTCDPLTAQLCIWRLLCNNAESLHQRRTYDCYPKAPDALQVLGFFAKMGLALRERPPMMLVDGDTLDQERKPCREADKQAPVFHTLGLCLLRGHGHVKHVVHSQPGLSSVYRQPSLNATLRPADLSQVEYEVTGSLLSTRRCGWCRVGSNNGHHTPSNASMTLQPSPHNLSCMQCLHQLTSGVYTSLKDSLSMVW